MNLNIISVILPNTQMDSSLSPGPSQSESCAGPLMWLCGLEGGQGKVENRDGGGGRGGGS